MNKKILLIVEGKVSEQNIFSNIFKQYGFNVVKKDKPMDVDGIGEFTKDEFELNNNSVVIIQGPRNRIHDFLKFYNDNEMSIEKAFSYSYAYFNGIFLIYDVDHNDCDDVNEMFDKFQDETTGLLLLSSPCIEVLCDFNRNRGETRFSHLTEYKKEINCYYNGATYKIIEENFNDFLLYFLEKNYHELESSNVMEHPSLVLQKINELNERVNCKNKDDSYVIYRYFSTVIYVAIAYANGLTKQIDNYELVKAFFLNQKNNCD